MSIQGKISKPAPTKSTPVNRRLLEHLLPDMPEGRSLIHKSFVFVEAHKKILVW